MRTKEWPGRKSTSTILLSKFWHDVWTEVSCGEIHHVLPGTVFLSVGQNICKKERPGFLWKHFPCKVAQLKLTALLSCGPKPAEVSDRLSAPCRDLAAVLSPVGSAGAGAHSYLPRCAPAASRPVPPHRHPLTSVYCLPLVQALTSLQH